MSSGRVLHDTAASALDGLIYCLPIKSSSCLPGLTVAGAAPSVQNILVCLHLYPNYYYYYIFIAFSHEFHKYIFIHIYPKDFTRRLVKLISTFNKIAGHEINIWNPVAFLYTLPLMSMQRKTIRKAANSQQLQAAFRINLNGDELFLWWKHQRKIFRKITVFYNVI